MHSSTIFKTLCLTALCCAPLAAEEDPCCISSCECCPIPYEGFLQARHREANGIGYSPGYSSLDFFYASDFCSGNYGFIDARGHYFNDGKWASNLGFGYRRLHDCTDMISGYNVYWDWRDGNHQIGIGTELLWSCWDIRVNGYIPVNKKKQVVRQGFDRFEGHSAYFSKKYDLAMGGLDGSIGTQLLRCGWFGLHTSLGGYYFRGKFGEDFGGGYLRAKVNLSRYIELKGMVSYDNAFKWLGQGEVGLKFPFGPDLTRYPRQTANCCDLIALEERLVEQPERFEIIVKKSYTKEGKALHPVTGDPLTFYFVDNTSSSDGTFESPFPTLAQAEAAASVGDAIYVFPGNGPYNESITLQNLQLLGGTGGPFAVRTQEFGDVAIPTLDKMPLITSAADTITLANQNRITGLTLSATNNAIRGNTITDFTLAYSEIFLSGAGVLLETGFSGTFLSQNNTISSTNIPIGITDGMIGNFYVDSTQIRDGDVVGIGFSGNTTGNIFITNSSISAAGNSIFFDDQFSGECLLENNTLRATGICVNFDDSFSGTFTSNNNQLTSTGLNVDSGGINFMGAFGGLFFANNTTITASGSANGINFDDALNGDFSAKNTSITTLGTSAFGIFLSEALQGSFFLQNASISSENFGVLLGDNAPCHGDITILDSSFISANQVAFEINNGLFGDITVQNSRLDGSVIGLTVSLDQGNAIVENSQFLGRNNSGCRITLNNSSLLARNNLIEGSDGSNGALSINCNDTYQDLIVLNNAASNDAAGPGIRITASGSTVSSVELTKNRGSSAGATAILLDTVGNSIIFVESPNLNLTGVQAINEGTVSTSGDVRFVEFD